MSDESVNEMPGEIEEVEIAPLSDDDLEGVAGGGVAPAAGCTCDWTECTVTGCTAEADS